MVLLGEESSFAQEDMSRKTDQPYMRLCLDERTVKQPFVASRVLAQVNRLASTFGQ